MNINSNQTETAETKCCMDICTANFDTANEQLINSKRIDQMSASELLNFQKRRREFSRRTSNFVIN